MSATDRFRELNTFLAHHLAGDGFRRRGQWFLRDSGEGRNIVAINLRKLPQPGSKRIVFQAVTYAGHAAAPGAVRAASLEAVAALATFERRLLDGAVEHFWTLWPSSDAAAIAAELYRRLRGEALVFADQHLAAHPAGDTNDATAR